MKAKISIDKEYSVGEIYGGEMRAKKAIDKKMGERDKEYSMGELPLLDTEERISALETALATHLRYHFGGVTPPK